MWNSINNSDMFDNFTSFLPIICSQYCMERVYNMMFLENIFKRAYCKTVLTIVISRFAREPALLQVLNFGIPQYSCI